MEGSHTISERFWGVGARLNIRERRYQNHQHFCSQFHRKRLCNMTFRPAYTPPRSEIMDERALHRTNYEVQQEASQGAALDRSFEKYECQGYYEGYHQDREATSTYSFSPRNENMQYTHGVDTMTSGYRHPIPAIQSSGDWSHCPSYQPNGFYDSRQHQLNKRRTSWANYEYYGRAEEDSPSRANSDETVPTTHVTPSYSAFRNPYEYYTPGPIGSSTGSLLAADNRVRERDFFSPSPANPQNHSADDYLSYSYQGNVGITEETEIPEPKHHRHPPTSNIVESGRLVGALQPLDITCGRGAPANFHYGNQVFRDLVEGYQTSYLCAKRSDKPGIAMKLLDLVKQGGGRFVRRRKAAGPATWETIGDKGAYEKVCQALRDGAPDLSRHMLSTSSIKKHIIKDQDSEKLADSMKTATTVYHGSNEEHAKENSHRNIMRPTGGSYYRKNS
jgi:hypothetical protein